MLIAMQCLVLISTSDHRYCGDSQKLLSSSWTWSLWLSRCESSAASWTDPVQVCGLSAPFIANFAISFACFNSLFDVASLQLAVRQRTPIQDHDELGYPEELDLSEFTQDGSALHYRLFSVVTRRGLTVNSGHYIAAVRTRGGGFQTISDRQREYGVPRRFAELQSPESREEPYDSMLLFYVKIT